MSFQVAAGLLRRARAIEAMRESEGLRYDSSRLFFQRNPFELRASGWAERVYRRYRFHERYARLPLVPAPDAAQLRMVEELRREGTLVLRGYLPAETVHIMRQELQHALEALRFETPCLAQSRIDPHKHRALIDDFLYGSNQDFLRQGVAFERGDVRTLEQVVHEFSPSTLTAYLLETSEVYRKAWLDPYLLTVIASYLGLVPLLAEAYVRRNFPARFWTMNHFWHRDLNDRHQLLKMFVFLSDCSIETGPHEYIRRSHRDLAALNGKRYFTDAEVDALHPIGSALREVSEVKAGTVILEDTRGLHRARMPDAGYRDLGYAVFLPMAVAATAPAYYRFPRQAFDALSRFQQAFVPSSALV
jgi:hypothetical protein